MCFLHRVVRGFLCTPLHTEEALSLYSGVMRPYPHPRSDEALRGLAAWRGAQAGCHYAEAFEAVFRRI